MKNSVKSKKEVVTQKVGSVKVFINNTDDLELSQRIIVFNEFEIVFKRMFEGSEYKDALYFDGTYNSKGDLKVEINISILFNGIYQSAVNYEFIQPFLVSIIDEIKNHTLVVDNISYLMAIQSLTLISLSEIYSVLERAYATIQKVNNEDRYLVYENEESVIDDLKKQIKQNFYFINCYRETKFHEIDPKLFEARMALALGLNNTSLSMLCITLEEMLKTLLKYNSIKKEEDNNIKPSLGEISEHSLRTQKDYGSKTMAECIYAASHEKLINDEEKKLLKRIYDYLRNALLHSDKSKLFSKQKTKVYFWNMVNGKMRIVETKEMSAQELIYSHGYLQQYLAKREGKRLFHEIEDLIYSICYRFWNNDSTKKVTDNHKVD